MNENKQRNMAILQECLAGTSKADVAKAHDISRQRVSAILNEQLRKIAEYDDAFRYRSHGYEEQIENMRSHERFLENELSRFSHRIAKLQVSNETLTRQVSMQSRDLRKAETLLAAKEEEIIRLQATLEKRNQTLQDREYNRIKKNIREFK